MYRISTFNMHNRYLSDLNNALVKQNKMAERLSSGQKIMRASDDPIGISRSLRFRSSLAQNEQYHSNYGDAASWMQTTDDALQTMSEVMHRVKELVVEAANDTNEPDRDAIGKELDSLLNTLVDLANTDFGGRYIFAGQSDQSGPPYSRNPDGTVSFAGDNHYISLRLQSGAVSPAQDSVNVTCSEAFGSDLQLFNQLNDIVQGIKEGTADGEWLSYTALSTIETNSNRLLTANAIIGARMSSYDMMGNMIEGKNLNIKQELSDIEDLNYAEAISEYMVWDTVYNASLKIGSMILPMSLVNFL